MDDAASTPIEQTINVRVAIRCATIEAFVDKYWRLVDGDRIFIFSSTPQPATTRIRFHLVLSDGTDLIRGEGRVIRARQANDDPSRPPGMDVRFAALDESSRNLIEFLHATRSEQTTKLAVARREESAPVDTRVDGPAEAAPGEHPTATPTTAIEVRQPDEAKPEAIAVEPPTNDAIAVAPPAHDAIAVAPPTNDAIAVEPPPHRTPDAKAASDEPAPKAATPAPSPRHDPHPVAAAATREPGRLDLPKRPSFLSGGKGSSAADLLASRWTTPRPTPTPSPLTPTPASLTPAPETVPSLPPARPPSSPSLSAQATGGGEAIDRLIDEALVETPENSAGLPVLPTGESVRFKENWRTSHTEPRVPSVATAEAANTVPANPFANIGDEAIEFFVEWSLEQSKGEPSADRARFADVNMSWGTPPSERATSYNPIIAGPARPRWFFPAVFAAAGLAVGVGAGVVMAIALRSHPPVEKIVVAAPDDDPPPVAAKPKTPAIATAKSAPPPVAANADPPPDGPKGTIAITTRPPGARVLIDGMVAGETPLEPSLSVGEHRIVVERDRYTTVGRTITIAAGAASPLDIGLARPNARLRVTSEPSGASVSINRVPSGKTPLDIPRPAFEHYKVHAELAGCKPIDRALYLLPDSPPVALRCPQKKR